MTAAHRCTHVDGYGQRCTVTAPARLEIHHLTSGHGIEAADHELVTRCPKHNPGGPYAA